MPTTYSNELNVSLPMAVWLCNDTYDYDFRADYISVTTLLKPIREIVLAKQNTHLDKEIDIGGLVQSKLGSAFHEAADVAWDNPEAVAKARKLSGIAEGVKLEVSREQRGEIRVGNWTIGGKYDLVINGKLSDYKSTGTYAYTKKSNDVKYVKQASMYRNIFPNLITDPIFTIEFLFTDWKAFNTVQEGYPQTRTISELFPLMSVDETTSFMVDKLDHVDAFIDCESQSDLPLCTDEELWRGAPQYKYYKNPDKKTRATKNFDNELDANIRLADDGFVGVVDVIPAKAMACNYCSVRMICDQAKELLETGQL